MQCISICRKGNTWSNLLVIYSVNFFFIYFQTFYDIGAVEPLKNVASSPNATASKLAAQALKIIGEDVPHKLTPQVPVWNIEDVAHWVKQVSVHLHVDYHSNQTKVIGNLKYLPLFLLLDFFSLMLQM